MPRRRSDRIAIATPTWAKASSARSSGSFSPTRGCRGCRLCWRSRARTGKAPTRRRCASSRRSTRAPAARALGRGVGPVDYAERRLAPRKLVKLGIDAAELVGAVLVAGRHGRLAHRERLANGLHRSEAAPADLGLAQRVEIDLDVVHLLHAADVSAAQLLIGVDEGARALEACGRVDDLVTVHGATSALRLLLRPQRELGDEGQPPLHAVDC